MNGSTPFEAIYIQVNAKMLGSEYFSGITSKTINKIYNYIMNLKIIHTSKFEFMNAFVSDCDFCYDFLVSPKPMQEANQLIFSEVTPANFKYVQKPFRQKTNVGLQFNERAKATPSKPYIKIYHKSLELQYKSVEFYDAYFSGKNINDIGRIEFTVKNSKHRKYLNLGNHRTLENILTINDDRMKQIINSGIPEYIKEKSIIKDFQNVSPTDKLHLYYINALINKGYDKQALYQALEIYDNPQERYRMNKKLQKLLENIDDNGKLQRNAEVMNMLRILELDL